MHAYRTSAPIPQSADILALTGFRFLAAFFVLLGHGSKVVSFDGTTNMIGELLGPLAACGMTMFFVLSGFLMWFNYGELYRKHDPIKITRTFAVARFARLYPMLLCTLLLVVLVRTRSVAAAMPDALLYPLMMNAWFPGDGPVPITMTVGAAAHTWSISAEVFCYLLFPILAFGLCRARSGLAMLASGLLFLALLLLVALLAPRHLDQIQRIFGTTMPPEQLAMWITYYSPVTRIFEFGLGCVAACYFGSTKGTAGRSGISIAAGLTALSGAILIFASRSAFTNLTAVDLTIRAGLAAGSALLVYGMASHPDHLLSRLLSTRAALIGGQISYSTYLLHPFVLGLLVHHSLARSTWLAACDLLFTMIAAFAAIYVISYFTYRVIEVPSRRWLRSRVQGNMSETVRTLSSEAPS